ncbi:flagellar basal body P-ring formation chaperone FlgA [Pseudaminobacter soli (ex Zhang et al. 2022)]|nr:flagellar basal body P-ring formation chaperone FlgA [Pseudaminobacter soli]
MAATLSAALGCAPALAGQAVLVPNRVIYPGETIVANALRELILAEGKVAPENVVIELSGLEGKIAKRTLLPGRYVRPNALREAYVVEKGVAVEMIFAAGGLTISATAVTLEPGSAGDMVKLRNVDSGKIVSGTVMGDGTVRVGG